jgi:ABC-type branched-subunit amino acid transport system substrate-binding protein
VAKHLDEKMKKIAMVIENTDFAQGFAKAYKGKTTAEIVHEQTYNSEEKDFDIIAKNIKAKE